MAVCVYVACGVVVCVYVVCGLVVYLSMCICCMWSSSILDHMLASSEMRYALCRRLPTRTKAFRGFRRSGASSGGSRSGGARGSQFVWWE